MTFQELNLINPILRAVAHEGYEKPSPIQEQAIPLLLEGRDLLGCAQTGTGKTAAFAIPILQRLYKTRDEGAKRRTVRALILTPTRELAAQVGESFRAYGRYTGLRTAVIFGGVGQEPQVAALRAGVDILVATPGRLMDLMNQRLCDISEVAMFVLDEADRMLDMGFVHDVKRIVAVVPQNRQTLLFSATMPQEIAALANSILHKPATVTIAADSPAVGIIAQSVYFVDKPNKIRLLVEVLKDPDIYSALVFSRTKHGADRISRALSKAGIDAGAIHGDKSQGARQRALSQFATGKTRVLVATDIAARGIDIDQLSCVINYDLPNEPETYVHRIGRTGRAGAEGVAISFCDFGEKAYLKSIEKLIDKAIPVVEDHPYPMEVFEVHVPQTKPRPRRTSGNSGGGSRDGIRIEKTAKKEPQGGQKPASRQGAKPTGNRQGNKPRQAGGRSNGQRRRQGRPNGGPKLEE